MNEDTIYILITESMTMKWSQMARLPFLNVLATI